MVSRRHDHRIDRGIMDKLVVVGCAILKLKFVGGRTAMCSGGGTEADQFDPSHLRDGRQQGASRKIAGTQQTNLQSFVTLRALE